MPHVTAADPPARPAPALPSGADLAAVEHGHQTPTGRESLQLELRRSTVCRQGLPPFVDPKRFSTNHLYYER